MPASADRRRFDRRSRLRTRRDFDDVFQGGRKLVNRQLVLWYRPAAGDRSRVGLSVSRRVGDAVRRNRVKRCLRAAFRALAHELDPALDMVLIARPGQPPRDGASAEQALAHLLRRLRRDQRGQARERGRGRPRGTAPSSPTTGGEGR